MLDLTSPQNYLLTSGLGAGIGAIGGAALPRGGGARRGALRGAVAGIGGLLGSELGGRGAAAMGANPGIANLLRIIGAGAGAYGGHALTRRLTRTPRERVQDDADSQVADMFKGASLSPESLKNYAMFAGAGALGTGVLGAGMGAIGGALSPRGSGLLPGLFRGGMAGAGAGAGGAAGDAIANAAGVQNPLGRAGARALGMLLGGYGGYSLGRKITKTDRERLEEEMLKYYTDGPASAPPVDPTKMAMIKLAVGAGLSVSGPLASQARGLTPQAEWEKNFPKPGVTSDPTAFMAQANQNASPAVNAPTFSNPQPPQSPAAPPAPTAPTFRQPAPGLQSFTDANGETTRTQARGGYTVEGPAPGANPAQPRYVTAENPNYTQNVAVRTDPAYGGGWGYATNSPMSPDAMRAYHEKNVKPRQDAAMVAQQFPAVGKAGTPENVAFVRAYNSAKAQGQTPDIMQLAVKMFGPGAGAAAYNPQPRSSEMQDQPPAPANVPPPENSGLTPEGLPTHEGWYANPNSAEAMEAMKVTDPLRELSMRLGVSPETPLMKDYVQIQKAGPQGSEREIRRALGAASITANEREKEMQYAWQRMTDRIDRVKRLRTIASPGSPEEAEIQRLEEENRAERIHHDQLQKTVPELRALKQRFEEDGGYESSPNYDVYRDVSSDMRNSVRDSHPYYAGS